MSEISNRQADRKTLHEDDARIKVSVIIPVFNGSATVREAVDSVLDQSSSELELIVVDDGSTDSTPLILDSYGDRILRIRQSNAGPAVARNAGARSARGEYLAFLDADDRWLPGMLRDAIIVLDADRECVVAYGNMLMVDSDGRSLATYLIGGDCDHAPSMKEILGKMWPIMPSAALIRRSTFDACGGFVQDFRGAGYEDAFLWLRLREEGHFCYVPQPWAAWRFSWFPTRLKSRPCSGDADTFARLVSQRYGIDPSGLVAARIRATRSILGYAGLRALQQGNRKAARRAFAGALKLDPLRARNVFRFVRTFLPLRIARSLSGRTAKSVQSRMGEPLR